MTQYIDKADVVAEIGNMLKSVEHTSHCDESSFNSGRWKALTSIKDFLNTIEMKEVDLEKEIKSWLDNGHITDTRYDDYDDMDIERTAKHFFELGFKTKGE